MVTDDQTSCRPVIRSLDKSGSYEVAGPCGALEALRFCAKRMPEILLVDLQLQDITAAEFVNLIRGRANGTRYLALFFGMPRGRRKIKLSALPPSDGYIAPSDVEELSERLTSLTRQASQPADEGPVTRYQGRHLDAAFDRVRVAVDGVVVDLARRELGLLQFLVTHPNQVLRRSDILAHVWRNENDGRSRTIDVHIRKLRLKLGAAGKQIQTLQGVGYRFQE